MAGELTMRPGDPGLPISLGEVQENYRDHERAARYELEHGTDERAAVHATLADAAARMAQVLARQDEVPW